jgi:hypothetical protein
MNKKKLILSSILSVVLLGVLVVCYFIIADHFASKSDGEIQIVLIDLDNNIISDQMISFKTGDTLDKLLQDNYDNVVITDGMIMSIEDYNTPTDWSTFISIYVDDKMSEVGLSDIEFKDGTKISLIITEFISDWE